MGESHDWHWHAHLCQHETPSCLPSHSHHHNADSTHSGRAKAALGTIPPPGAQGPSCPGAQVPRCPGSPLCVGGQAKGEREPDKECEMRARPRTLTQLLRTKNMSTRVRTIIKNVLLNINCATSPPSKPIVSREQYTRVF